MNKQKEDVAAASDGNDLAPIDVSKNGSKSTAAKASQDDEKKAKPKEVLEFEKKNSGRKKIKVRDGSTGG